MVATEPQSNPTPTNTGNERVAVLLMGYGEVESYEDFANYNEQALHLLTGKFAPIPTWLYPPFARLLAWLDFREWGHQHDNFISPHNEIFERQRAGIEQNLQAVWGDRVEVFKAFNFCAPYLPDQVIANIKEQGFDKLLIYPLLVVDSIFTSGIAVEQVNKALAHLTNGGRDRWLSGTRYIPSFFDRSDYIDLLARLVEDKVERDLVPHYLPSRIGIILLNHGCPHKAKGYTSGITESEALYERVRERLINKYPLVSVGWLNHDTPLIEWTQPNAELAAENVIKLGASAVVMMPIGFATENHETILDVDHIIGRVRQKHPAVAFERMPCVNDHPEFLQMAADWASEQIEGLLSEGTAASPQLATTPAPHYHGHGQHHY